MGIGIMQGRLVPPAGNRIQQFPWVDWTREFALAREAGLDAIEWIYEEGGTGQNPLSNAAGIKSINTLADTHGIRIRSVCADYFMDFPLVRGTRAEITERTTKLGWLIGQAAQLGAGHIVLPFVDSSKITGPEDADKVVSVITAVLPQAETSGVELHLETALPPGEFAALLARLPHPLVRANYDSGNSASLGYAPGEEFAAYGDRVGSVHIKDRIRGGGTVPLGTGHADFDALFNALELISYRRDFILQVARGTPGDEVAWARQNYLFVERRWKKLVS